MNRMPIRRSMLLPAFALVLLAACSEPGPGELVERARTALADRDMEAAVIDLKSALRADPEFVEARRLLGEVYIELDAGALAEKELDRARQLGDESTELHLLRARAQLLQGNTTKAAMTAREHRPAEPGADYHVLLGDIAAARGDFDQAREAYDAARAIAPDGVEPVLGLAAVALAETDYELAERWVSQAETLAERDPAVALARGDLEFMRERLEPAQAAYTHAIELQSRNLPARFGLTRVLLMQQDAAGALQQLDELQRMVPRSIEVKYLRGYALALREDRENAIVQLRQVLRDSPDDARAQLVLAILLAAEGQFEQALELADKFNRRFPRYAPGAKVLASIQLRDRRARDAVGTLSAVEEKDADVERLLGSALFASGEFVKAGTYLEAAAKRSPGAAGLQTQLAMANIASGHVPEGIANLEEALSVDPQQDSARALLIYTLLRSGDYDTALLKAEEYTRAEPDSARAHNFRGVALLRLGRLEEARAALAEALELQPDYVAAAINLADLDVIAEDAEAARARMQALLKGDPDNVEAMMYLARLDYAQGDFAGALQRLEAIRAASPRGLVARLELARSYLSMGLLEQARPIVEELRGIAPDTPAVLAVRAETALLGGDVAQALSLAQQLVAADPEGFEANYQLGLAQLASGALDQARAALDKARAKRPGAPMVLNAVGRVALARGELDDARDAASRLLELQPDLMMGHELMGDVHLARGEPRAAIGEYELALERAPITRVVQKIARVHLREQRFDDAEAVLAAWVEKRSYDVPALMMLAELQHATGDLDAATALYERVLDIDAGNAMAANNLANILFARERPGAVDMAARAHEGAPDNPLVLDTYGWILVKSGKVERGLDLLRKAVSKAPDSPSLRYHLAVGLAAAGDRSAALAEVDKALAAPMFGERAAAEKLALSLRGQD